MKKPPHRQSMKKRVLERGRITLHNSDFLFMIKSVGPLHTVASATVSCHFAIDGVIVSGFARKEPLVCFTWTVWAVSCFDKFYHAFGCPEHFQKNFVL